MRFLYPGITLLTGLLVACNSSSSATEGEDPSAGEVQLSVEVSGQVADSSFIVEASQNDSIAGRWSASAGDPLTLTMNPGTYAFELSDVADICLVESENPQDVEVSIGGESSLTFQVGCLVPGEVKVTINTTGEDQDNLYALVFNTDFRTILVGPYQFITATLPVGSYTLELTDVDDNCTVQGENPVSLDVTEDVLAEASFEIVCTAK
jgi:hypothetical protein